MLTRNLEKMSEEKLNNHLRTADKFLRDIQLTYSFFEKLKEYYVITKYYRLMLN